MRAANAAMDAALPERDAAACAAARSLVVPW